MLGVVSMLRTIEVLLDQGLTFLRIGTTLVLHGEMLFTMTMQMYTLSILRSNMLSSISGAQSLPNLHGNVTQFTSGLYWANGVFGWVSPIGDSNYGVSGIQSAVQSLSFLASRSSNIYKDNADVHPNHVSVRMCIRY